MYIKVYLRLYGFVLDKIYPLHMTCLADVNIVCALTIINFHLCLLPARVKSLGKGTSQQEHKQ
jgi:hypothetical protein